MPSPKRNTGGQIPIGLSMDWRLDIMALSAIQNRNQVDVIHDCIRPMLPKLIADLSPEERESFASLRATLAQNWGLKIEIAAEAV